MFFDNFFGYNPRPQSRNYYKPSRSAYNYYDYSSEDEEDERYSPFLNQSQYLSRNQREQLKKQEDYQRQQNYQRQQDLQNKLQKEQELKRQYEAQQNKKMEKKQMKKQKKEQAKMSANEQNSFKKVEEQMNNQKINDQLSTDDSLDAKINNFMTKEDDATVVEEKINYWVELGVSPLKNNLQDGRIIDENYPEEIEMKAKQLSSVLKRDMIFCLQLVNENKDCTIGQLIDLYLKKFIQI